MNVGMEKEKSFIEGSLKYGNNATLKGTDSVPTQSATSVAVR